MLVIGLTGGIGSGKSSAAKFFAGLGAEVIDTDEIAHQLTQSQGVAIAAIRLKFGENFITTDGALDREKMRSLVFSDDAARQKLQTDRELAYAKTQAEKPYLANIAESQT